MNRFPFLALVAGSLLIGTPSLAQNRPSVADTNPTEFVNPAVRDNMRAEASRLQHEGVLLVRLTKAQQEQADVYRAAFQQEFTVAPVYFFPSDQTDAVVSGQLESLQQVSTSSRPLQAGNFLIADIDPKTTAIGVSTARNETLWQPESMAAASRNSRVDVVALKRAVGKLNKRLLHYAADETAVAR